MPTEKKKQIEIVDTQLYYSLLELWKTKDYSKEGTIVRNVTTEIEIRKRIGSFKITTGAFDSKHDRIELESNTKIVILRRKTGEEDYFEKAGIPLLKQTETGTADPETRVNRKIPTIPCKEIVYNLSDLPF